MVQKKGLFEFDLPSRKGRFEAVSPKSRKGNKVSHSEPRLPQREVDLRPLRTKERAQNKMGHFMPLLPQGGVDFSWCKRRAFLSLIYLEGEVDWMPFPQNQRGLPQREVDLRPLRTKERAQNKMSRSDPYFTKERSI